MHEDSFQGLAVVAAVGFIVPLLLGLFPKFRLPSVVLEIAAGVIIGPSVLGWVHVDTPIAILSRIGLATLLFLAGLEIEMDQIKGTVLKVAGAAFLVSLLLSVVISYGFGMLGLVETPLFVAIILAASALGVVIPILKDAGETTTTFGKLVIVGLSIADFGTIVLLALLFSGEGGSRGKTIAVLCGVGLLCAFAAFAVSGMARWKRLTDAMLRLQDTTAMIRVRGAAFLVIALAALVEKMGLEVILGAFAAGLLLSFIDRDAVKTHPQFHMKLQAVGFGVFVPIFFVTSGLQFNLKALLASGSALAAVPLFLAALLVIRGLPAVMYRPMVGTRKTIAAGLLQATTLSFVVAGVRIGVELGKVSQATAAALIAAAMLSVLIFPMSALMLLREKKMPVAKVA